MVEQVVQNKQNVYILGEARKDLTGNLYIQEPQDPSLPYVLNSLPNWKPIQDLVVSATVIQVIGLLTASLGLVMVFADLRSFPKLQRTGRFVISKRKQRTPAAVATWYTIKKQNGGTIRFEEALEALREHNFVADKELPSKVLEAKKYVTITFLRSPKRGRFLYVKKALQLASLLSVGIAI